jgi:hypothetical protein
MKKTRQKRLALGLDTVRILAELPETKLRHVAGGIQHSCGGPCSGTTGSQGNTTISDSP